MLSRLYLVELLLSFAKYALHQNVYFIKPYNPFVIEDDLEYWLILHLTFMIWYQLQFLPFITWKGTHIFL